MGSWGQGRHNVEKSGYWHAARAYLGVWGPIPQWSPRAKPLVRGLESLRQFENYYVSFLLFLRNKMCFMHFYLDCKHVLYYQICLLLNGQVYSYDAYLQPKIVLIL